MNESRILSFLEFACWLTIAAMAGLFTLWSLETAIWDEWPSLMEHTWFRATLIDLYAGFALLSAWFWIRERKPASWLLWTIALAALGNLTTLAYVALAARRSRAAARPLAALMLGKSLEDRTP